MLTEQRLQRWLSDIRRGRQTPQELIERLRRLPFDDVGVARLDTHRHLRRGLPEAVFCQGKTVPQLTTIVRRLLAHHEPVLLTRLDPPIFAKLHEAFPQLRYDPIARLAVDPPRARHVLRGLVIAATGGTSDIPVAEEAAVSLEFFGSRVTRLYDVGVAGMHRVLSHWSLLQRARAIIVVAGMEGALASVVAGLVRVPVVAVPTSIGYGANFHGIAPLLTMLNSCAPGIGVVNIDNGFGAACLAHLINTQTTRGRPHAV